MINRVDFSATLYPYTKNNPGYSNDVLGTFIDKQVENINSYLEKMSFKTKTTIYVGASKKTQDIYVDFMAERGKNFKKPSDTRRPHVIYSKLFDSWKQFLEADPEGIAKRLVGNLDKIITPVTQVRKPTD